MKSSGKSPSSGDASRSEMVTVEQALAAAIEHHQGGRLAEAEVIYRRVLEADERNADALHLLGVIAIQVERYDLAVEPITKAISINGVVPAFHANLGIALKGVGRLDSALASFDAALRLDPGYADAHHHRGLALQGVGRWLDALAAFDAALAANSSQIAARYGKGVALQNLGRLEEALAVYDAVRAVKSDFAELHFNRGNVLLGLGRQGEALVAYDEALHLHPAFAEALSNKGNVLTDLGRLNDALDAFDEALRIRPNFAEALSNRAAVFQELDRLDEALAGFDAALRLDPGYAQAHCNRGNVLLGTGRLDAAVAAYDAALQIAPDHAGAHYNRGYARLCQGRLAEGWPDYEWRWRVKNWPGGKPRHQTLPQWRGEAAVGRTVLLWAEQGLGDSIHFMRYLPAVAALGWGSVVVVVQRPLLPLFAPFAGPQIRIVADGDPLPPADAQCPFLSLPLAFGTGPESLPGAVPYLRSDPARQTVWQDRLPPAGGLRVGVVWQGNPGYKDDRNRSVPLRSFAPLAAPGVRLISLQKTHGLDQLADLPAGMSVENLGAAYDDGDFADTAAVIASLDAVVAVDTAVAHLAGALGRPVWVALSVFPDWRWMMEREDTPWYPTMRLVRQAKPNSWDGVFERIADGIAELAAEAR